MTAHRVLVDADGCPVVDLAVRLAAANGAECLLFCDTAHLLEKPGATTIQLPKGPDSVDFALANHARPGDAVVTQDYGLAAMCLARGAAVLNQDGMWYTPGNIDGLLAARHTARKLRAAGTRTKGPKKRTAKQNDAFAAALGAWLQNHLPTNK